MRPSFADFVGVALFSALASGYYQPLAGHEECAAQCDFHETQREYEDCIKRCTGTFEIEQRSAVVGFGALQNATYPAPPTDLRVQVNVIVERSEKILQAVVHWSYEPDQHRTGFYLRVLATSEWCEQAFSGYYAQNIGPLASSHPIPLELAEPRTLKIMHNCTYEVQMHSKPYPYADDKYKALIYHWVPPCVDGYCSCRSQKPVPEPRQVEILTFYDPIDEATRQIGRHPNIVALYGCCTIQHPQCVIMEYIPYGDLKRYLQNLRKQYERALEESMRQQDYVIALSHHRSPSLPVSLHSSFVSHHDIELPFVDAEWPDLTYSLDPAELESFAIQVANGMAHIESLGITHRDLAARNILVGHGKLLKISDFGLSRHGVYVKTTRGVIPLRWLSVEAMRDNIYSNKSDVWAYGVVLWEICTLGGFPYPTTSDKDLVRFLESGGRLEKPASCSDQVYELMMECWSYCAEDRPSFAELRDRITDLSNQGSPYVEFADRAELPPPEGLSDRSVGRCELRLDPFMSVSCPFKPLTNCLRAWAFVRAGDVGTVGRLRAAAGGRGGVVDRR
uniref:Protein kinase domain-containing protein n=1 Tax=Plectus sambesii TaxID=2011161 RepID=A0A914W5P6_9BILA